MNVPAHLRQCLGKFSIIFPVLGSTITACHNYKLFDRAAFYCLNNLICKSQNLCMCKSADEISRFNFGWCRAFFGVFNDSGKVLLLPDFSRNMGASWISGCAGGVESVLVAVNHSGNFGKSKSSRIHQLNGTVDAVYIDIISERNIHILRK